MSNSNYYCDAMGQLIDFGGKNPKGKTRTDPKEADLVSLLPRLRALKGEMIVFNICDNVIADDELLTNLVREIVMLKCMGVTTIIVPDANAKAVEYYRNNYNISDPFANKDFQEAFECVDELEISMKQGYAEKIAKIARSLNTMPLVVGGSSLDVVLPDEIVNKNVSTFDSPRTIYNNSNMQTKKKYSIDMLDELVKTDILPILIPTFKDQNGNNYVLESSLFGAYISQYLSALKYVIIYTKDPMIPSGCIYGIERFTKILKTSNFNRKTLSFLNSGVEAVRSGTQGTHVIDTRNVNLLEEFCGSNFSGLFLYDDTLNQL